MHAIRLALAATLGLGLAACGESDTAEEASVADSVEMPADEAMRDAPMPLEDNAMMEDDEPVRAAPPVETVERQAERAADDAQSAVDDAIAAAEESME